MMFGSSSRRLGVQISLDVNSILTGWIRIGVAIQISYFLETLHNQKWPVSSKIQSVHLTGLGRKLASVRCTRY